MNRNTLPLILLSLSVLALAACGSSGGNSTPPPPPGPVTPAPPPPPPPEPTFEERLAEWAEMDPNACRAQTPGFEALGGWLKDDGRELGASRVWVGDQGALTDSTSHGASVWKVFADCAVRSTEDQYARDREDTYINPEGETIPITVSIVYDEAQEDGRDLIVSSSFAPPYDDVTLPQPTDFQRRRFDREFSYWNGDREDGQRILEVSGAGNDTGKRTGHLQSELFQVALERRETALRIIVGGYSGDSDSPRPAGRIPETGEWGPSGTSICGAAEPLCLFAPWRHPEEGTGTSIATPQVAAALDTVWAVWPDMDILDLRNLAFDCAENQTVEGVSGIERTYSYSNGRSFTSTTNSTWGHGILSVTCLFTPNGGLQNPVTGDAISGGIIGPIAGPVTGATITGVDYTGRDFGYGFARPVARENWALLAMANLSASGAISWNRGLYHAATTVLGAGATGPAAAANLTVAGNALGLTAEWRTRGLTIRVGVAVQPEGVGSLTGSRAFRAPSTVSAAVTAAYGRALPHGFSMHIQADHWQTVATQGRSLWEDAELSESRISAALVKRMGRHELALQAVWQSGLAGSLDVHSKRWPVAGARERGVWLTWRRKNQ